MKIWKWEIEVTDEQTVVMPAGARLLDVQVQRSAVCLWALCDPSAPREPRHIMMYGTGHTVPDQPGEYLTTFQTMYGALVFHVFDMKG